MTSLRAAWLILCCASFSVSAASAMDEAIEVPSRTISDQDFLRGDDTSATPVTLTGNLSGPDREERQPVVILLHGTDGPRSGAAGNWRRYLNGIGVTTLVLDSYTGRGLTRVSTNQGSFGQFTQIYDVYRAADVLAAHPRIDGSRVALMGFSRGGTAALYAAMTRFREAFGPEHAAIVAHLPFYPACNFALVGELQVADVPIREFHGADDDWTPAAPCRGYIARLRAAGADAVMTEYPGALHGFDNNANPAYYSDDNDQTSRNCFRREENGRLVNAATGAPFTYQDACVEYGPSSQYNDAAATAAQAEVKSILAEVFEGSKAR
jgi:dienelactone hydrolase